MTTQTPPILISPRPIGSAGPASVDRDEDNLAFRLLQTVTLALWLGCVGIGAAGWFLKYPRPRFEKKEPPPVAAERIEVETTGDPSPAGSTDAAPDAAPDQPAPPAPPAAELPADAPPLAVVAAPSPAIAFALPTPGPSQLGDARRAVPAAARSGPPPTSSAIHRLGYGNGRGGQPRPDYPREALFDREQGSVGTTFTIGPDGQVTSARVTSSSHWPLLDEAVAKTVRQGPWHLSPGVYEIFYEFKITGK